MTTRKQEIPKSSPPKASPKPMYSHMVRVIPQAYDPGKVSADLSRVRACDKARDTLRDKSVPLGSRDLEACDHGNQSHDLPRDRSSPQSCDHT